MFQIYRPMIGALGIISILHIVYLLSFTTTLILSMPTQSTINLTINNSNKDMTMVMQEIENLKIKTPKPIIGILTQVLRDYKRFSDKHQLHLVASYVKWVESAGAQVLPILLNKNESYYEQVFKQTNGLLLPGGDNLLDPTKRTPMMVAAKKLYSLAVEANDRGDYYPIWGTCLGMELLSVLTANQNVLESCEAMDEALTMKFVSRGRLFARTSYANLPMIEMVDYSGAIVRALSTKNITFNAHHKCLTDEGLRRAKLEQFYRPLAYSTDSNNNKQFIAVFEALKYPFFGVQFHPEKPPYEFVIKHNQYNVPHSREAIAASRYFADFFVQQAQLNGHQVGVKQVENQLIYAYNSTYTAPLPDMYEQRYLFPYDDRSGGDDNNPELLLTEEFLDHVPVDGEDVPEDVSEAGKSGPPPSAPIESLSLVMNSDISSLAQTTLQKSSNGIIEIELLEQQADDVVEGFFPL